MMDKPLLFIPVILLSASRLCLAANDAGSVSEHRAPVFPAGEAAHGDYVTDHPRVANVSVLARDQASVSVAFDIDWANAWRDPDKNHDAVWVVFKWCAPDRSQWHHARLAGGGMNPVGFDAGAGTPLEGIVPADRTGIFLRLTAPGRRDVAAKQVTVMLQDAPQTDAANGEFQLDAFAVRMVYVAQGAFYLGSGGTEANRFYAGGTENEPFRIDAEDVLDIGDQPGKLAYRRDGHDNPMFSGDLGSPLPAAYPKGYAAFYCMKYPITQGQYADFLNRLTPQQAAARFPNRYGRDRHTLRYDAEKQRYLADTPLRACNQLSWADGAAFGAWAGLRPMSELEYEKACRGPRDPVPDEYAWGTTRIESTTAIENDGTAAARAVDGNCNYNLSSPPGPFRVGIYAASGETREATGASYWGIDELSGNLWERPVTVGRPEGRSFTGRHGDGSLTDTGAADVAGWPGVDAVGAGHRGGQWNDSADLARVSDRRYMSGVWAERIRIYGWRGVRTAPRGVEP